ncbi:hypothetical protein KQX54_007228 [Cotesia glomerata]|uniref:Uncharacterized protein n=1 Tax=Cotesia glomerata TaxID=32391 RepID=A0AAV7I5W4_COTGL|nr:hypothetical protein KQX54_007228 [Cotesia glomerata]
MVTSSVANGFESSGKDIYELLFPAFVRGVGLGLESKGPRTMELLVEVVANNFAPSNDDYYSASTFFISRNHFECRRVEELSQV